ncbi:MAG: CoA-binding protein [Dethiobacteria bacterium]|jgi:acyl-CoA synthetase (NDP forming)
MDNIKAIDNLFHPRSIAVAGASRKTGSHGYQYLRFLLEAGYPGRIYPVNPRKMDILGLQTYTSLEEIPENVDYVICCINDRYVVDLLRQCARKKVQAVHLYTAKLSETGDAKARRLEEEIKNEAQG